MYKRESFQPLPDRAPYFWVETPIGRLCFARRLSSQTRSWGMELLAQQAQAQALVAEGDDEKLALAGALIDASVGLFIARHWVDEEFELAARQAYRAGELHPMHMWDDYLPKLETASLRYGWLTACELSEWDLTNADMISIVTEISNGRSPLPGPVETEEASVFSDPPKVSGISA